MSTDTEENRFIELGLWLEERHLSYQLIADAAGVSRQFISLMLSRETMPDKRHRQMLLLGLPEHLLPRPFVGAFGRPRKRVPLMPHEPVPPLHKFSLLLTIFSLFGGAPRSRLRGQGWFMRG